MKKGPMRSQRGAIAVLVGLSLVVLVAITGLALDLGTGYMWKTELQNAADAAALAGAKRLDGTVAGVNAAVADAIGMAAANRYDFAAKDVAIGVGNLSLGTCPQDGCMVAASSVASDADAAGRTFFKVDTGSHSFETRFIRVMNVMNIETRAVAVAGKETMDVAPIGVCAIDPVRTKANPLTGELIEYGFRRGIAYNIFEINPLGGAPGVPIWINPYDTPPAGCDPAHSSATALAPFLCTGKSLVNFASLPANVYANTGFSAGPTERALNSRFELPAAGTVPPNTCNLASAPPDRNIKIYDAPGSGTGKPKDWMNPDPALQGMRIDPSTRKPVAAPSFADYGALWSYSRAVKATTDVPPKAGVAFGPGDWPTLYSGGSADTGAGGYPGSSPYSQDQLGNKYFSKPGHTGSDKRRVLNIAVIDCAGMSGAGLSCSTVKVVGIGRFFMQTPASLSGGACSPNSNHCLYGEFDGLFDSIPDGDIKLYR